MVVGAWMLCRGLATPDDVMATLARLRKKDVERASRRSPETEAQIAFMKTWSESGADVDADADAGADAGARRSR